MQQTSRFGISGSLQLQALIADLNWRIQLLNSDIMEEEQRSHTVDATDVFYPTLAKHLRERRDKLASTVLTLEAQLIAIDPLVGTAAQGTQLPRAGGSAMRHLGTPTAANVDP